MPLAQSDLICSWSVFGSNGYQPCVTQEQHTHRRRTLSQISLIWRHRSQLLCPPSSAKWRSFDNYDEDWSEQFPLASETSSKASGLLVALFCLDLPHKHALQFSCQLVNVSVDGVGSDWYCRDYHTRQIFLDGVARVIPLPGRG